MGTNGHILIKIFINAVLKFMVCMVKDNECFVGHLLNMAGQETGGVTQLAE